MEREPGIGSFFIPTPDSCRVDCAIGRLGSEVAESRSYFHPGQKKK